MNHWTRIIGICALTLSLGLGCASQRTAPDPDYVLYQEALKNQKPLVSMEWSADGQRLTKLEIQPAVNIQQSQQNTPHPVWGTISTAIRATGAVFGIVAAGNALEGIAGSVQGNSSYTSGGNMSGGDMSIPTTTTTETITNTETMTETMTGTGWE